MGTPWNISSGVSPLDDGWSRALISGWTVTMVANYAIQQLNTIEQGE